MSPESYLYISITYLSIALLTGGTLCLKGYNSHRKHRYMTDEERSLHKNRMPYILHALHIPPYLIASYWYYDAYEHYNI